MTWTHHVVRGMDDVINGSGTVRERVRDVLVHAEDRDWPETRRFAAGGRIWHVRYHKHRSEDSRLFSAEATGAAGNPERVILWYGTGSDLPHARAQYAVELREAISRFRAQLRGEE